MNLQVIAPLYRGAIMVSTTTRKSNAEDEIQFSDLASSDRKFEVRATQREPDAVLKIRKGASMYNTDMSVFVRDAVDAAVDRLKRGAPLKGEVTTFDLEGGPLLDVRVACGPPEEAHENATIFKVSKMVGDEIGFVQDSGFFARVRGESMVGAGIPDESIVCFLPLPNGRRPFSRQIALVAFKDGDGNVTGTVKRWMEFEGNLPRLQNGDGKDFDFPKGTIEAWPVAVATGVIGAL